MTEPAFMKCKRCGRGMMYMRSKREFIEWSCAECGWKCVTKFVVVKEDPS
jgi:hypothetical protein